MIDQHSRIEKQALKPRIQLFLVKTILSYINRRNSTTNIAPVVADYSIYKISDGQIS